METLHNKKYRF